MATRNCRPSTATTPPAHVDQALGMLLSLGVLSAAATRSAAAVSPAGPALVSLGNLSAAATRTAAKAAVPALISLGVLSAAATKTGAAQTPVFGQSLTSCQYGGACYNGTDQTVYVWTVTTPTTGRTAFVWAFNIQTGGAAVTPTVAGLGLTWVQRATATLATGTQALRCTLFTGTGTPSGTALTVTHSATQLAAGISGCDVSNVNATTPVVASIGTGVTQAAASITLSPAPTSGLVLQAFMRDLQEGLNPQPPTGVSMIDADWGNAPGYEHFTAWTTANPSAVAEGFYSASNWVGIGAEVKG